jgi:hypothetical protein
MQGFSAVYACFEGRSAQIEYGFGEKWWLEVATWWVLSLLFFFAAACTGFDTQPHSHSVRGPIGSGIS